MARIGDSCADATGCPCRSATNLMVAFKAELYLLQNNFFKLLTKLQSWRLKNCMKKSHEGKALILLLLKQDATLLGHTS